MHGFRGTRMGPNSETSALIMEFAIPEIKIKLEQKQCLVSRLFTKNLITENRGSKKEEFN